MITWKVYNTWTPKFKQPFERPWHSDTDFHDSLNGLLPYFYQGSATCTGFIIGFRRMSSLPSACDSHKQILIWDQLVLFFSFHYS